VRKALLACEGVRDVKVDFDTKEAVIIATGGTDRQKLLDAVNAGYANSSWKKM
jgi:copper chaperone CopZ